MRVVSQWIGELDSVLFGCFEVLLNYSVVNNYLRLEKRHKINIFSWCLWLFKYLFRFFFNNFNLVLWVYNHWISLFFLNFIIRLLFFFLDIFSWLRTLVRSSWINLIRLIFVNLRLNNIFAVIFFLMFLSSSSSASASF